MPPAPRRVSEVEHFGFTELIGELTSGLSTLVSEHLELARVELLELGKGYGAQVAKLLVFAPFLLVGWIFCCAAGGAALAMVMAWPFALLIVGGFNLLLGGAGVGLALVRLRRTAVLERTRAELGTSAQALARLVERERQEVDVAR